MEPYKFLEQAKIAETLLLEMANQREGVSQSVIRVAASAIHPLVVQYEYESRRANRLDERLRAATDELVYFKKSAENHEGHLRIHQATIDSLKADIAERDAKIKQMATKKRKAGE